tara:strand:+ start:2116 stop:2574 length:459 start_codon:yes stop_codon:yes gene_type:complete
MMLAKSAAIPASTLTQTPVNIIGGGTLKIAGTRTIDNWSATFISDNSMQLRDAFENWQYDIVNNESWQKEFEIRNYLRDIQVIQLERDGSHVRNYVLHGCFPLTVSEIALSYDDTESVQEFSVDFSVSHVSIEDETNMGAKSDMQFDTSKYR